MDSHRKSPRRAMSSTTLQAYEEDQNNHQTSPTRRPPETTKRKRNGRQNSSRLASSTKSLYWQWPRPWLVLVAVLLNLTTLVLVVEETKAANEAVIKITRFQVPSQVRPGEHRRLACLYELQGATLHAMKLFKDNKEFYRYTPADHKMTFPVVGIQVDLARSGEREVWIRTGKRSAGSYKCQVSIEGTFNSVIEEKRMEVVGDGPSGAGGGGGSNWHQKELASGQQQKSHLPNHQHHLKDRAQTVQQQQQQQQQQQHQMTFTGTTGNTQPVASLSHQFFSSSSSVASMQMGLISLTTTTTTIVSLILAMAAI